MTSDPRAGASKRGRPWLRFGLRTLLALVTVIAAGSAWLGWRVSLSRQEEQVIAKLTSAGDGRSFNLHYDNAFRPRGGPGLDAFLMQGPQWLTSLLGTDICRTVTALQCVAPGNEFAISPRSKDGSWYYNRKYICGLSDADMREVAKLKNLRGLGLEANPVTDGGIAHVIHLRQIESLGLAETKITDESVRVVVRLPKLRYLDLSSTDITKDSMDVLAQCTSLRELIVRGTHLTKEEVQKLGRLLPACNIVDR